MSRKAANKMKTVKLADLLKMWECQQCPHAHKEKNDQKLICGWDEINMPTDILCCKILQCGSWPEFYNDEVFNQIKIPR